MSENRYPSHENTTPEDRVYDIIHRNVERPVRVAPLSAPTIEEMLRRQVEEQQKLCEELKQEAKDRSKDDKKYFWLGVAASLVISLLVEHGPALILAIAAALQ